MSLCAPCLCTLSASEITFDNFVSLVDSRQQLSGTRHLHQVFYYFHCHHIVSTVKPPLVDSPNKRHLRLIGQHRVHRCVHY